ncbi:MAG: serine acetyltransferase [Christensenellaceae bacterium]|nr:serine acetyltransferase [Christensenellaceae bacterium]
MRNESHALADELAALNSEQIIGKGISGFGMKGKVIELIDELKAALFPSLYERSFSGNGHLDIEVSSRLNNVAMMLNDMIKYVLSHKCKREHNENCTECTDNAERITLDFMNSLSDIRKLLATDIEAAYLGDPAAIYMDEILLSYPSIEAVTVYRLAHKLFELKVPLIPRIMTEHAHQLTGIDIHPGATIGDHFFIDHGTGVVIGETCVIGSHVKLYQGVTLGAKSFELDEYGNPIKGVKRHPNIEDNVVIYSGATILGGNTTVGSGSIIGGNVWLVESVPPNSKVYNKLS